MEALAWQAHPYLCPQLTCGRLRGARASGWHTGPPKGSESKVRDLGVARESMARLAERERVADRPEDKGGSMLLSPAQSSQKCVSMRGSGSGEG